MFEQVHRVAAATFSHLTHTHTRQLHLQCPTLNFHSTVSRIHVTGMNNKMKRFLSVAQYSVLDMRAFKVNYGDDVRIKSERTTHTMCIVHTNAKLHICFSLSFRNTPFEIGRESVALVLVRYRRASIHVRMPRKEPTRNFRVEFQSHNWTMEMEHEFLHFARK